MSGRIFLFVFGLIYTSFALFWISLALISGAPIEFAAFGLIFVVTGILVMLKAILGRKPKNNSETEVHYDTTLREKKKTSHQRYRTYNEKMQAEMEQAYRDHSELSTQRKD